MNEEAIKTEVRTWALESLVTLLWAAQHAIDPDPQGSLNGLRDRMLAKAANQTFPGLGPTMSDHVSAEFESAISRLVEMQREWLCLRF